MLVGDPAASIPWHYVIVILDVSDREGRLGIRRTRKAVGDETFPFPFAKSDRWASMLFLFVYIRPYSARVICSSSGVLVSRDGFRCVSRARIRTVFG